MPCIAYFLFAYLHIFLANLVLHIVAYFVHISAYLNLHIIANLPLCILKHKSIYLHKMCIYSYFFKCIFVHCDT